MDGGAGRQEERTYFDNIVIYTLYDFTSDFSLNQQFFESYKETLKTLFQQEEILIVVQDLFVI